MSKKAIIKEKKRFSFLNNILYPACTTFVALILGIYSIMFFIGVNVTETRDKFVSTYNGELDDYTSSWAVGKEYSLSLQMLIGIFLFCLALFALSYIKDLEFSKLTTRLLHFVATMFAFFLFVLAISGYIADSQSTVGTIMIALVLAGMLYFICLGIKLLLRRPIAFLSKKYKTLITRLIAPATVIFAFSVIFTSILSFCLKVQVKINEQKSWDTSADRTLYEEFETIITPLAPTLQNYLRYLGTAFVIVLSIWIFALALPRVAKGFLNFAVCTAGFFLLWFIQLDFFHELDKMRLYSIIFYLALYAVVFTAAAVTAFILKRKREKTEDYEAQFSPKRKK